jgi:16S rRNA (adenine1518-N6/adenine1519-N6)-dimethyltransferase
MTSPKKIMKSRGIRPLRRYGQSFLQDRNVIGRIVDAADIRPDDTVVEIGPGPGTMTGLIAEKAKTVIAVEIDPYMADILEQAFRARDNLTVVRADILTFDLASALPASPGNKLNIIGNIPYNISTPILFHLLAFRRLIRSITIMLQKEVAERLGASPGTKDYGIPTVAIAMYALVTPVTDVPPSCFYPKPKVTSRVIRIDFREEPLVDLTDEAFFTTVVKTAFSQRRKTIFNNLKSLRIPGGDAGLSSALCRAGIDGVRRAETLSAAEFGILCNTLADTIAQHPENY